jgi:hypothetical protein
MSATETAGAQCSFSSSSGEGISSELAARECLSGSSGLPSLWFLRAMVAFHLGGVLQLVDKPRRLEILDELLVARRLCPELLVGRVLRQVPLGITSAPSS